MTVDIITRTSTLSSLAYTHSTSTCSTLHTHHQAVKHPQALFNLLNGRTPTPNIQASGRIKDLWVNVYSSVYIYTGTALFLLFRASESSKFKPPRPLLARFTLDDSQDQFLLVSAPQTTHKGTTTAGFAVSSWERLGISHPKFKRLRSPKIDIFYLCQPFIFLNSARE